MSVEFERKPLSVESFPPNLQMHVKADSPPQMKMMAARGMVPAPPAQLLQVLYQLQFDDAMREMATKAVVDMPESVILPAIKQEQPAGVLDWVAEIRSEAAVHEALVLNKATDDLTVLALAASAEGHVCEIISNNQVRVLRTPAIIEALYKNTKARMATVDKLIDLAQRNNVDLSGLPGLLEALKAGGLSADGGLDDDAFARLLSEEGKKVAQEDRTVQKIEDKTLTRREREELEKELLGDDSEDEEVVEEKRKAGNLFKEISDMNTAQKIRLATVGSREAIMILIRDTNKLIHMAAVKSPRLRIGDVRRLSANKSLPEGVIKYMSSNRDWTRNYDVMVNLTMNPKTPLSDVMSFMNHLRANELRTLSKNRNVSQQVARIAKQLLQKRGR